MTPPAPTRAPAEGSRSDRLGRDYRLLWSAAVASRFGDSLRTPALALLAATLTRDPRAVVVVTIAAQLPPMLFGLLGGVYADRWDRRRTMAAVDGLRAAVVAALAVLVATGRAGAGMLALAAFLLAALGTLFDAASFAVPALGGASGPTRRRQRPPPGRYGGRGWPAGRPGGGAPLHGRPAPPLRPGRADLRHRRPPRPHPHRSRPAI
ncbi:MFS transporter [Micromonospora olivasterospora]|uniref:Transmembrane secretion effector n=1 Tax=Micromonospora olivasterospora TaxID=1880 RepID=A0A562I9Y0_MICOL|nr:MFS transporter [Micromonospora olivasterospora]TWH67525.1 transmembrane secretion effector [Micromonospora olivasterospora]